MNSSNQKIWFIQIIIIIAAVSLASFITTAKAALTVPPNTITIKDDTVGGECAVLGNWDFQTKICTLSQDFNICPDGFQCKKIVIANDYIILDGNNHSITSDYRDAVIPGIDIFERQFVTIKNLRIENFGTGISIGESQNITITNNDFVNNIVGLDVYGSNFHEPTNEIYNNNFIDNTNAPLCENNTCVFNLSAPIGGNYWSNFDEPLEGCNDLNHNGLCDSPYFFNSGQDNLPWTQQNEWLSPPNNPPTISFPTDALYAGDGIDPNKAIANATPLFFKIIYTDADNNQPSDIALVVDDGVSTRVML